MSDLLNIRSPFKFLDPYEKEDHHLFFGRDKEVEQLYERIQGAKLLLVYGASGTGKTSLINCGLTNKFGDTDWNPLFIRRGENMTKSTLTEIQKQLKEKKKAIDESNTIEEAVSQLFWTRYIPVYLIFDQFEELFIQGDYESEILPFFDQLSNLLKAETFSRIILILREEYLAWLSGFEEMIPEIFDNRIRIEKMSERNLQEVLFGTLTAKEFDIELREGDITTKQIIENIRGDRREVDLTDLQVYLDHLYRRANLEDNRRVFDAELTAEAGGITNVLATFLEEQILSLEKELKTKFNLENPHGIPLEILFTLVTNEMTKRTLDRKAILQRLKRLPKENQISPEVLDFCLAEYNRLRIINYLD